MADDKLGLGFLPVWVKLCGIMLVLMLPSLVLFCVALSKHSQMKRQKPQETEKVEQD